MNKQKLQFYVFLLVGIISGGVVAFYALKYLLPTLAPFALAWIIAMATDSPSGKLSSKLKVPKRIMRLFLSLLAVSATFTLVFIGVWQGAGALWRFLNDMGEGRFYDVLSAITNVPLAERLGIPSELYARFEEAVAGMLSSALSLVAGAVSSLAMFVPRALFFILITVIALIYFALDLERINSFVKSLLPRGATEKLSVMRSRFFGVFKKYVLSYLTLMLITFVLMLVGFLLIEVKHAFLLAAVVALLDVLPVLGVGTVLVPWSVFCFATGDAKLGIGLAVLFVVNTVLRQVIEPKIVGKSLDMHPILTLFLLYAGYLLFGIAGVLLVPVAALIIGTLINRPTEQSTQ